VRFYRANTEDDGAWIAAFLEARIRREELFGLYTGPDLVATGECTPSLLQPPYADLGLVVARAWRGRGLGRTVLLQLKQHCYAAGWEPICSCAADNLASKKAIENAGFVSEHRVVKVLF
jgi:RimJ/RimL family protein N-acetyltransferase